MIPFFRKIRKKMADDNKPLKYMRYAIGEIVLVVIGILIALSLNNWKKDLDNHGEELRILNGLKQEFEMNLMEVNRNIKLNTSALESIVNLLDHIRTEDPFNNLRYVDSLLYKAAMGGSFDAQAGIINEVISSGKLSFINDTELRNRLTSVSGILDNAEEDYNIRTNYYMEQVIPFLSKYFALVNQEQFIDFSSWSETYKQEKYPNLSLKQSMTK